MHWIYECDSAYRIYERDSNFFCVNAGDILLLSLFVLAL